MIEAVHSEYNDYLTSYACIRSSWRAPSHCAHILRNILQGRSRGPGDIVVAIQKPVIGKRKRWTRHCVSKFANRAQRVFRSGHFSLGRIKRTRMLLSDGAVHGSLFRIPKCRSKQVGVGGGKHRGVCGFHSSKDPERFCERRRYRSQGQANWTADEHESIRCQNQKVRVLFGNVKLLTLPSATATLAVSESAIVDGRVRVDRRTTN